MILNVQIHYFTGTGNTKYIAELFASVFKKYGFSVHEKGMEEGFFFNEEADYLIIGFPKYYGYVPLFYMRYLEEQLKLQHVQNKPKVILFCTQAATTRTSFKALVTLFEDYGYPVVWAETFALGNNYMIKEKSQATSDMELFARISQAQKRIPVVVDQVLRDITFLEEAEPERAWKAIECAKQMDKISHQLMRPFSVEKHCTLCMKCVQYCPMQAIEYTAKGQFIFLTSCVMCVRCVSICPENAITYDGVPARQYLPMMDKVLSMHIFCRNEGRK